MEPSLPLKTLTELEAFLNLGWAAGRSWCQETSWGLLEDGAKQEISLQKTSPRSEGGDHHNRAEPVGSVVGLEPWLRGEGWKVKNQEDRQRPVTPAESSSAGKRVLKGNARPIQFTESPSNSQGSNASCTNHFMVQKKWRYRCVRAKLMMWQVSSVHGGKMRGQPRLWALMKTQSALQTEPHHVWKG